MHHHHTSWRHLFDILQKPTESPAVPLFGCITLVRLHDAITQHLSSCSLEAAPHSTMQAASHTGGARRRRPHLAPSAAAALDLPWHSPAPPAALRSAAALPASRAWSALQLPSRPMPPPSRSMPSGPLWLPAAAPPACWAPPLPSKPPPRKASMRASLLIPVQQITLCV